MTPKNLKTIKPVKKRPRTEALVVGPKTASIDAIICEKDPKRSRFVHTRPEDKQVSSGMYVSNAMHSKTT